MRAGVWERIVKMWVRFSNMYGSVSSNVGLGRLRREERVKLCLVVEQEHVKSWRLVTVRN
jgi:hypothetical protein